MLFPDYFSQNAANYARYRPQYPKTLFDYLSHLVEEQKAAWDCGTGNGQVACELTDYFEKVYASDASEEQIKQARISDRKALQAGRIDYFISLAESTPLDLLHNYKNVNMKRGDRVQKGWHTNRRKT